jgi:L-alanine-DL-glutamate epimerase-like enolase superfamily enzyme
VANRSAFKDGRYVLPQGPGWGLELDKDAVEKFTVR